MKRAKAAGGTEAVPHHAIGEHRFIAVVKDLDGNLLGLHSQSPDAWSSQRAVYAARREADEGEL